MSKTFTLKLRSHWFVLLAPMLLHCGSDDTSLISTGSSNSPNVDRPDDVVLNVAGTGASKGGSAAVAPQAPTGTAGQRATGLPSAPAKECRGVTFEQVGGGGAEGADEACAGVSVEAEAIPVDLFLMMDRSISMNEPVKGGTQTRWEALRQAVEKFVAAARDRDIRVGIGFFGLSGSRDDAIDCDAGRYARPTIEIGPLSSVGEQLVQAIEQTAPGGLTPTLPALQGALSHAREWAVQNPGRATSVVLVTDGFPTQCQSPVSLPDIADVAAKARNNAPFVRTFVIGLAAGFNLDSLALAGGTNRAYLVDEADVTDSFASALGNISDSSLLCDYELPQPPSEQVELDYDKVQILYTPAQGDMEEVPRIGGLEACGRNPNGGFYYDDPTHPTKISVCPCTCSRFAAGRVDVRLGCTPFIGVR